ncbi:MAG: PspC domain-containing protein [Pseudohongiellaceae bacterium]
MTTADPRPDNRLRLNREQRKLLGVCSGFARYLDVPVALVRLIYVVACLVSPALIFVYFVLYWLLDEDDNPSKMRVYVSDSKPASHFKRIDYRRPLYRNTKKAWIGGVCAGIAEYMDIRPALVRFVALLSLFVFGGATLWAYIACWIVLDKKPRGFSYRKGKGRSRAKATDDAEDAQEASDHDEEAPVDPVMAMQRCADTLHRSEARLRELEAFITSRKFRLHCEINRI